MSKEYRYIGKQTPRKDSEEIVTGKAEFFDDIEQPKKMLHGKVLRSPHPHANIKDIQTADAEALNGVRAVLTYKNVPGWKMGLPPHVPIVDKKVRYVGDAVALIAAETEEIAYEALEMIDVEYEELPAVYDVEEAISPGAPQLYSEYPGNLITLDIPAFGPKTLSGVLLGDVEEGFEEADIIAEGTCSYENIPNPLPLEPPGVIAKWEGDKKLTVWSPTQSPSWHRFIMQLKMGFPDIRTIGTHCGGSFGSKNYAGQPMLYAAALAKATGRPVKVYYSKEEHFGAFSLRLGSRFRGKIGIKKDGTLTAISGDWFVDTGAFSDMTQAQMAVACGEVQLILRCPNWDLKAKLVCTNRNASGVVRGFGGQELESALLPVLNSALAKGDIDPVRFYKQNFVKPGDSFFWRDGNQYVFKGQDYSRALDKGAEAFGWEEKWKGWLKPTTIKGKKRIGVGVGAHGNADVGEDESEAYVRLNPDATVTIHVNIAESGMGQRSNICKMAAEVLQVPLEAVSVTPVDSLVNPFDFGLVGSRGTYAVGSAVIRAAEDAIEKLFEKAAPMLKSSPDKLESIDGRIYIKGKRERGISWRRIIGITGTCTGFGRFEQDHSKASFMFMFVEVEVDTETGKTDLLKVVAATDAGQIIDPKGLEGQIHGGLGSAGIDSALFEETVIDRKIGRILNPNMMDYKWRTFLELPEFNQVVLETPVDTHRYKAIGVGEISTSPGPRAILMAVSNAVGKTFFEYPLTPDKILSSLGKIKT